RLRRIELGARGGRTRVGGEPLEVQIRSDEHDELTGAAVAVTGGAHLVRLGTSGVDRLQVEHRLLEEDAGVEYVERADDAREKRGGGEANNQRVRVRAVV